MGKEPSTTVSVIVPTFNQAAFLREAVDSALHQSVPVGEVIVVDDGSTDDTADIIRSYGTAIRSIRQANQGLAAARNTGLRAAHGDLVASLDSDDAWLPNYVAEMVAFANRVPTASAYYCGVMYVDQAGEMLPQDGHARRVARNQMYRSILRVNHLVPSTVLMRRQTILQAGGFDVTFRRLQDWELWIRLLRNRHEIAGTRTCLVRYRIHGKSLSTDPLEGQDAARHLVCKHFGPDNGPWWRWPQDKAWAYGGYYRYCALSALTRMRDTERCIEYLSRACTIDRSCIRDVDLFYEVALGSEPLGSRGAGTLASFRQSEEWVAYVLARLRAKAPERPSHGTKRALAGTAHYALGLLAFHTGLDRSAEGHLLRAACARPSLVADTRWWNTVLRCRLGPRRRARLRTFRNGMRALPGAQPGRVEVSSERHRSAMR